MLQHLISCHIIIIINALSACQNEFDNDTRLNYLTRAAAYCIQQLINTHDKMVQTISTHERHQDIHTW